MKSVVLCADETSLRHPECLHLEGEVFQSQPWLRVFSEADEARAALRTAQEVEEVWVVSNDQVDPINLAATFKSDRPDRCVYLVIDEPSGSLLSRVGTAHIDGVLTLPEFVGRYARKKQEDARAAQNSLLAPRMSVKIEQAATVSPVLPEATYEEPAKGVHGDESQNAPREYAATGGSTGRHAGGWTTNSPGRHVGAVRADALGKHASLDGIPFVRKLQQEDRTLSLTEQAVLAVRGYENHAQRHDAQAFVAPVRQADQGNQASMAHQTTRPLQGNQPSPMGGTGGASNTLAISQKPGDQAFLLPIVSGSGGSGKSTLAVMAALLAHRAGLKTLLIDLDLQFGDMFEVLGYSEALSVDAVLASPARVKHLRAQESGPALLRAPQNIEQAEDLVTQVPSLLDLVMPLFDVVVVNTGSFWSELQAILLERCSRAIFVVDQRPSSLRGCTRALDLCTRCGIAASPILFVVNKCCKQALYSSIDVSCALNGAPAKEVSWGGDQVEELLAAGQAAALLGERNAFVETLSALLVELIPAMATVEPEKLGPGRNMPFLRMLMGGSKTREEQPCR